MFTPHNMSHVTCHVSCVTCHVSHVTCHVSHVTFFFTRYLRKIIIPKISRRPTKLLFTLLQSSFCNASMYLVWNACIHVKTVPLLLAYSRQCRRWKDRQKLIPTLEQLFMSLKNLNWKWNKTSGYCFFLGLLGITQFVLKFH